MCGIEGPRMSDCRKGVISPETRVMLLSVIIARQEFRFDSVGNEEP